LGYKAIKYKGPKEIEQIFLEFDKNWAENQNWDCYSEKFSPAPVMKRFNDVFLKNDSENAGIEKLFSIGDKCVIQYYRARKKLRSLSRKIYQ
jgi:hypothetical protein